MSKRQRIAREMAENPNLERALAVQLVAMGYVIKHAIPLEKQLNRIPDAIFDGLYDGIKSAPKAGVKAVGGIFNLVEEVAFGALNAFGSGPKIPSYRQSLIDAKKRKLW